MLSSPFLVAMTNEILISRKSLGIGIVQSPYKQCIVDDNSPKMVFQFIRGPINVYTLWCSNAQGSATATMLMSNNMHMYIYTCAYIYIYIAADLCIFYSQRPGSLCSSSLVLTGEGGRVLGLAWGQQLLWQLRDILTGANWQATVHVTGLMCQQKVPQQQGKDGRV